MTFPIIKKMQEQIFQMDGVIDDALDNLQWVASMVTNVH